MMDNGILSINKPIMTMSNLSFEHPLSNDELFNLQKLLSSPIALSQVYFKDDIDLESIERVKLLLEGFPNINDSVIEKYIIKDISEDDKEILLNMNFTNIDTWNISYLKKNNQYSITSLVKYRKMEEWFREIIFGMDDKLSMLERMCYLYDKVKMLEFDCDPKYNRLSEIICDGKANSYGYNLAYKELLLRCGIKSVIGKISGKNEDNYITLVNVNDVNHNIKGLYAFDPSMDTIYKNQYKNNLARKMNYNFFCCTFDKLKSIYKKRNMQEFLRIISSDDMMEFNHVIDLYNEKEKLQSIENEMGLSLKEMNLLSNNSIDITSDIFIKIVTKTLEQYPQDIVDKNLLTKVISDNYVARNNELFTNKNVKKKSKIDTVY